jgi:ribonuclease R
VNKDNKNFNKSSGQKNKAQIGIVKRHPDGFGFFIPDEMGLPDVYIPKQFMKNVMTNDKVEVAVYPEPGGKRFRGEVLKILDRAFKKVVGKYHDLNDQFGVILDNNNNWGANLSIPKRWVMDAKNDDLVIVEIVGYPDHKEPFLGKIIEVLGDSNDAQHDTKKVIINSKIPHIFPAAVEKESLEFSEDIGPHNFPKRKDISHLPLITIDGKTAKDFDDAIYVEQNEKGFRLIVAIADVSHYVKLETAIDTEAYDRGTSVYFPNFVVPMLPEVLSNELCSLKPHVYRLCLVADMQFDFQGATMNSSFYEAVMKSHARVTYGEAQEVIDGNCPESFKHVKEQILQAADLAKLLMARRFQAGSLDLEIPETEIIIDELGNPVDILRAERIFAHRLIEEMMLIANVEVARFLGRHKKPVLYRIHEPPKLDNIETLNRFLHNFGSQRKLTTKKLQKEISQALHEFSGRPEEVVLNILTLRSMNQAKYSPDNVGHFGLGFEEYCHFTSPIRRYPDLIVHRVLKNAIGVRGYEMPAMATLSTAGTILSSSEQRSVKAERQLHSIKKARFIQKYVGQEFEGVISSVAKFGVFVLLRQFDVDGLIKIEELGNDHFLFLDDQLILKGKRSGVQFAIGDIIKILVVSSDPDLGQINFALAGQREKKADRNKFDQKKHDRKKHDRKKHEGSLQVSDKMEKILKMLDEGASHGNHKKGFSNRKDAKKRGKGKDNSERSGKARLSKRSGKGKAR